MCREASTQPRGKYDGDHLLTFESPKCPKLTLYLLDDWLDISMRHLYRCYLTYTDAFPNNIGTTEDFLWRLYKRAIRNASDPVILDQEQVCRVYKSASIPSIEIIFNFMWTPRSYVIVCGTSCV